MSDSGVEGLQRRSRAAENHNFLSWNPKWNPRALFQVIWGTRTTLSPCFLWCRLQDSNPRPSDYKSDALPAELSRPMKKPVTNGKFGRMQAGAPHPANEGRHSGLPPTASLPRTRHICGQDSPVRREFEPPTPSRLMIQKSFPARFRIPSNFLGSASFAPAGAHFSRKPRLSLCSCKDTGTGRVPRD